MPAGHHLSLAATRWLPETPGPVPAGELHVWRIDLTEPAGDGLAHATTLLSADERARAARFLRPADHRRYVLTRAALRELLAAARPGTPAAALRFRYSEYGKPALAAPTGLAFNVSRDRDYALVALGRTTSIGVDLEGVDPEITVENLVSRFFAVPERAAVLGLPADRRHAAFFRTWTRKEAFIKAVGEGLSLPLDRFAVTVDPAKPVAVEWVDWRAERTADWTLRSFTVAEGVPGAVCYSAADDLRLRFRYR